MDLKKLMQLKNALVRQHTAVPEQAGKSQLWHSSPHKFDRFDISKIGSGEGNQSFGHGIYLAESPAVSGPLGQYAEKFKRHPAAAQSGGPHTYKVEVPNEAIAKMLDWDKPLGKQHPFVQDRLNFLKDELSNAHVLDDYLERKNADWPELTGGEFFRQIMGRAHMDDALPAFTDLNPYKPNIATSNLLHQMDIPGVKYLDQLSRGAEDGTRNLVSFSDDLPKIIERNGELLPGYSGGKLVKGALDMLEKANPEKTVKAYKLFRTNPKAPDELFPLFVNANKPVPMNQWVDAEVGPMSNTGKVKSKLGDLAYRPGWHAGDLPIATHIGGKSDPALKAPDYRPQNQVWAEIEMPADVDWQTEALRRAERNKAGNIIPRTAHITDQIPEGGHYRYKTNPNMTGDWMIGGSMKVNRVLSPEEVQKINEAAGVADLPPFSPLDFLK